MLRVPANALGTKACLSGLATYIPGYDYMRRTGGTDSATLLLLGLAPPPDPGERMLRGRSAERRRGARSRRFHWYRSRSTAFGRGKVLRLRSGSRIPI